MRKISIFCMGASLSRRDLIGSGHGKKKIARALRMKPSSAIIASHFIMSNDWMHAHVTLAFGPCFWGSENRLPAQEVSKHIHMLNKGLSSTYRIFWWKNPKNAAATLLELDEVANDCCIASSMQTVIGRRESSDPGLNSFENWQERMVFHHAAKHWYVRLFCLGG